MNDRHDSEDLLRDVLGEASPADFREASLGETLRLARGRRHRRRVQQASVALAGLVLLAILARQWLPRRSLTAQQVSKPVAEESYQLVRTEPLPGDVIITTARFPESQLVGLMAVVGQVATTGGGFRQINDDELLSLVSGKPAVLVRTGPHSEELVFANPKDKQSLVAN
jgi:hypothetical protein